MVIVPPTTSDVRSDQRQVGWAAPDLSRRTFVVLSMGLLALAVVLRLVNAHFRDLWDGDQAVISSGIVSLIRGVRARLYNYQALAGFYHFEQALWAIFGRGDLDAVRSIFTATATAAGILTPAMTLLLFPAECSRRVRLIAALLVVVNPLEWRLSQYGNVAIVSTTFALGALLAICRIGGWKAVFIAAPLAMAAALTRGDAVLAIPALAWFAWRRPGGGLLQAAVVAAGAAAGVAVNAWLAHRIDQPSVPVLGLLFNRSFQSHHLMHLYWVGPPACFLFAAIGWRPVGARPLLWQTLVLLALPQFFFYLPLGTTPRYLLPLIVPITITAAMGYETIRTALRPRAVGWRVVGLGVSWCVLLWHVVFTQINFTPGNWRSWITPQSYAAHDVPHSYGALLFEPFHEAVPGTVTQDAGARTFAGLAVASATAAAHGPVERWAVIVENWDDMNACMYYLITHREFSYHAAQVVRFGKLDIDFIFRWELSDSASGGGEQESVRERLTGAKRVFRVAFDASSRDATTAALRARFGGGFEAVAGHGNWVSEFALRDRGSRPASAPDSRPERADRR